MKSKAESKIAPSTVSQSRSKSDESKEIFWKPFSIVFSHILYVKIV